MVLSKNSILGVKETFLGFRFVQKNLKTKKYDLGGFNEKNEKTKGGFLKEIKSFRKKVCLFFTKSEGKREF